MKRVKIIKPNKRLDTWYNNKVNSIYTITREFDDFYFTRNKDTDGFLNVIYKEDCEEYTDE